MAGRYWEDFQLGETFVTMERTVTEADIIAFAELTGDFNPLHMDAGFAAGTRFRRRIAHGMLGVSIAAGLSQSLGLMEGTIVAFLGMEWRFLAPIFIGDTVHAEQTVAALQESSKPGRGLLSFDCRLVNQHGDVVQEGRRTSMLLRRPLDMDGEERASQEE